jgi:hypothetical protein
MSDPDLGEVLFEFRRVGGTVRVTAIHVATATEVVLVGRQRRGIRPEDGRPAQAGLCAEPARWRIRLTC